MKEVKKPKKRSFWKATNGSVTHKGFTETNQVTSSGLPTFEYSDNADLVYDKLPNNTYLNEGEIYADSGSMLTVKVSHQRTNEPINDTNFDVQRGNNVDHWKKDEYVIRGDIRIDKKIEYKCVKSHTITKDELITDTTLWQELITEIL